MEDTRYYIYLLTNKRHRVFFSGVTTHIRRRLKEHQLGEFDTFSKKYGCTKLVYFEVILNMEDAWQSHRNIESLTRAQKIQLITATNPRWRNLGDVWAGEKQFNSTSVLKEPPPPSQTDMAPPNRLPDHEMLTFDFEDS